MRLLNQPFNGSLGDNLIESLNSGDYHTFKVIVAFAKNSGVLRIREALQRFREQGGQVSVYVGVDLGGTSYEALTNLLRSTDALHVIHSERAQTFHSKIFNFIGQEQARINVGSHNLTGGGLWSNFESSIDIQLNDGNSGMIQMLEEVDSYIDYLKSLKKSFMLIESQDDIDTLYEHGYILKEVSQQVLSKVTPKTKSGRSPLFGKGHTSSAPRLRRTSGQPQEEISGKQEKPFVPLAPFQKVEEQTLWFETRRMTGGARNILDLSMTSLVEHGDPSGTSFESNVAGFMRGAVEFFGVNPTDFSEVKNININFEGVDYEGNVIKFAEDNGSWRLQFRGVDHLDRTFNNVLQAKDEKFYLVGKVLAFTRVKDDYYFMTVFPGEDLESFNEASSLVGRNGRTNQARMIGVL